jgi:hypothetical protein
MELLKLQDIAAPSRLSSPHTATMLAEARTALIIASGTDLRMTVVVHQDEASV